MSWNQLKEIVFEGFSPAQQWRVIAAAGLIILFVHAAFAHGVYLFGEGFLTKDQAEKIATRAAEEAAQKVREEILEAINGMRSGALEDKMRALHKARCREDEARLRDEYSTQIAQAMSRYREINGFYYRLTSCADL